ncbi:MAG TPA: hypothetical protein VI306_10680 [Pyrinomonadaceae bacterium]
MATSRRNFLRVGALCAIGAGVPAAVVQAGTVKSFGFKENYSKQAFLPYLNSQFFIQGGPLDKVEVVLEKVSDSKTRFGSESFSLLFKDPSASMRLGQSTYVVEHAKGEQFTLFVVPVGKPEVGLYQAVINTK